MPWDFDDICANCHFHPVIDRGDIEKEYWKSRSPYVALAEVATTEEDIKRCRKCKVSALCESCYDGKLWCLDCGKNSYVCSTKSCHLMGNRCLCCDEPACKKHSIGEYCANCLQSGRERKIIRLLRINAVQQQHIEHLINALRHNKGDDIALLPATDDAFLRQYDRKK